MMILVSQDAGGLQAAMVELLGLEMTGAAEDEPEERLHSPGYYKRIEYLLDLEELLAAGVKLELFADEVSGLAAIRRARVEFSKEHPKCEACGEPQWSRFVQRCHTCQAVFRRGA